MKRIFLTLVLFTIYYLLPASPAGGFTIPVVAASPSVTQKPISTEKITDLKERIASKVAQLNLVERRGVIGRVTEVSDTQITILDIKEKTRFIDVDELTNFSSPSAKESFGISDITKGSTIGVLGLYNKQSRRMLARFVDALILPKVVHGAVAQKDSENFTITVVSEDQELTLIDVENITKTMSFTKAAGLTRSGFSKIQEGERITVVGFPTKETKEGRLIASRILLFPDTPKNPKISLPDKALMDQDDIKSSTGGGKKLTPITR